MFDGAQILSNTYNHDQTRCPNGKMFGQQTFLVAQDLILIWVLETFLASEVNS